MIPTAVTEREITRLSALAAGKRVLEVGSLLGFSTVHLARVAEVVHAVDPHEGYPEADPRPTLEPFITNLVEADVRERVVVHVGTDAQVLPMLAPASFDLVFIDITGLFWDTINCMNRAVPLLRHSGVLAVHDCGHPEWPGVEQAVAQFAQARNTAWEQLDQLAIFEQTWGRR